MTEQDLKQYIQKGIENNAIVYDDNAPNGVITKRLIWLMKHIAYKNNKVLDVIFIPSDVYADFFDALFTSWDYDKLYGNYSEITDLQMWGIKIVKCEELNQTMLGAIPSGSIIADEYYVGKYETTLAIKIYKELGGWWNQNYNSLIFGIGKDKTTNEEYTLLAYTNKGMWNDRNLQV